MTHVARRTDIWIQDHATLLSCVLVGLEAPGIGLLLLWKWTEAITWARTLTPVLTVLSLTAARCWVSCGGSARGVIDGWGHLVRTAALGGTHADFAKFYDRYFPSLVKDVRRVTGWRGGVGDAEDIVQDTFVFAWENCDRVRRFDRPVAQAEQVKAEADLRNSSGRSRMSRDEIARMVAALGDLVGVLRQADPADTSATSRPAARSTP